jgi:hypothetical protein
VGEHWGDRACAAELCDCAAVVEAEERGRVAEELVDTAAFATREEMGIAMSNALALARWHGLREFRHASQNTIILWVLVGLVVLALLVWAVQRRRRRWF